MSDLFHPDVPSDFAAEVFAVMALAEQHTFQVLTKRPQLMQRMLTRDAWLDEVDTARLRRAPLSCSLADFPRPNVWLGTSVENQRYADLRIPHLVCTPAAVRFLSMEPLLGPVDLMGAVEPDWIGSSAGGSGAPHPLVDWVIIGGESGPGARPMEREWAESIVEQCQAAGVAVFVKQLGTVLGGKHHQDIDSFPESLRVREYPKESADV